MKKLFSMLLFVAAAAFATSCDIDDLADDLKDTVDDVLGNTDGMDEYNGTMTVTAGPMTLYTKEDAKFFAEEENDELEILMKEVKFADAMKKTLDITISGIAIAENGDFSIDKVTPTIAGIPAKDYEMSGVSGNCEGDKLTITFTCSITGMGDCTVTYSGIEVE